MNIPPINTRTSEPIAEDYENALDRAKYTILRFGRHDDTCPSGEEGRCNCGFEEAAADPMLWTVHRRQWRARMVALHGEDFLRRMFPNE